MIAEHSLEKITDCSWLTGIRSFIIIVVKFLFHRFKHSLMSFSICKNTEETSTGNSKRWLSYLDDVSLILPLACNSVQQSSKNLKISASQDT